MGYFDYAPLVTSILIAPLKSDIYDVIILFSNLDIIIFIIIIIDQKFWK